MRAHVATGGRGIPEDELGMDDPEHVRDTRADGDEAEEPTTPEAHRVTAGVALERPPDRWLVELIRITGIAGDAETIVVEGLVKRIVPVGPRRIADGAVIDVRLVGHPLEHGRSDR